MLHHGICIFGRWPIKFQLLDSTLQRLRDGVGAPDSNAVSVVSRRRCRNEDHGNRSASENGNSSNGNRSGGNGNRAPDDTFGSSMEANMSRLSEILEHLVETSEQDRQVAKKIREDDQLLAKKNLEAQHLHEKEQRIEQRIAQLRDSIDEFEEKFQLTQKSFYANILTRKREELQELEVALQQITSARTTTTTTTTP